MVLCLTYSPCLSSCRPSQNDVTLTHDSTAPPAQYNLWLTWRLHDVSRARCVELIGWTVSWRWLYDSWDHLSLIETVDKTQGWNGNEIIWLTRKPCCRKETARCRKCSFPLKFANNIHYKYKTTQASKAAKLRSSKHAGARRNLTQNQDSKSIKVTCLESVEKQWGNK